MAGTGIHPYHQQWPPAAAASPPPPSPAAALAPPAPPHPTEEVRTIFITGLPEDVKERELLNLMRWLPGFEASQLNFKAKKLARWRGEAGAVLLGWRRPATLLAEKGER
ncbi:RNA-binding protein with multiple splicing [Arachis hypogaea]|nr:RNA-binding protein with multiple splicing [Arachis hypogaea]